MSPIKFPEVNAEGRFVSDAVQGVQDDRFIVGFSTAQDSDLMAFSGTGTDVTDKLQTLFNAAAGQPVTITGDFTVCSSATFDWNTPSGVRMTKGSRLKIGGNFGIVRQGKWKFNEVISGVFAANSSTFTASSGSKYAVGDWIMCCGNTLIPNAEDFNYSGPLRRVVSITGNVITVDRAFPRTISDGRTQTIGGVPTVIVPGPWTVKVHPAAPFTLDMEPGSSIEGLGRRAPTLDGDGNRVEAPMLRAKLCEDFSIRGQGTLGEHPVSALVIENNIRGQVEATIQNIFFTSSSGYCINCTGATRDMTVMYGTRLLRGRHGFTTNIGPDMYLDPTGATDYEYPVGGASADATHVKLGGIGEPESNTIGPSEVAYMGDKGLDSHRAGWGNVYNIYNLHDCGGGVQVRADNTTLNFFGGISNVTASGIVVQSVVSTRTYINNPRVTNVSGPGIDSIALAAPAEVVNPIIQFNAQGDGGYAFDFSVGAAGTIVRGGRIQDVGTAFRFQGSGVSIIGTKVHRESVPTPWVEAGAGVNGNNTLRGLDLDIGGNIPAGGMRYFVAEAYTHSTGTIGVNAQQAAPIYLPDGVVKSLAIQVSTASAAGGTARLGIFTTNADGTIGPLASEVTVLVDAAVTVEGTLDNPVATYGGGNYYVGLLAQAAFSAERSVIMASRYFTSASRALQNSSRALQKTSSSGWGTWGDATPTATIARVTVGMALRS